MKTQYASPIARRRSLLTGRHPLLVLGLVVLLFVLGSVPCLRDATAQTPPLTIQPSTGNVGIKNTNPDPNYALDVTGTVNATNFKGDGSQLTNLPDSAWTRDGTTISYTAGKVGIGRVPGPTGQQLEVEGSIRTFGSNNSKVFVDSAGAIEAKSPDSPGPGGTIGLHVNVGSLPGYPNNTYPTLKVSNPWLYFSVGGQFSAYMDSNGVLLSVSTRERKENFTSLNPADIVSKIEALPISRWNYKGDDPTVTHIGPVAEDFNSLFSFRHVNPVGVPGIATLDVAGVALVGVQGLAQRVKVQEQEIADLKARLELLEQALKSRP